MNEGTMNWVLEQSWKPERGGGGGEQAMEQSARFVFASLRIFSSIFAHWCQLDGPSV